LDNGIYVFELQLEKQS